MTVEGARGREARGQLALELGGALRPHARVRLKTRPSSTSSPLTSIFPFSARDVFPFLDDPSLSWEREPTLPAVELPARRSVSRVLVSLCLFSSRPALLLPIFPSSPPRLPHTRVRGP